MKIRFKIDKTKEFQQWFDTQTEKERMQIDGRLSNIECYGHFGVYKDLEDDISELKWLNGRRVYYSYIQELNILLLLGGNKNGQDKDITKAKKIFKKYININA